MGEALDFHVAAIEEMWRIAAEAHIFPLPKSYRGPSPLLEPVVNVLRGRGYHTDVRKVSYEFQRGGAQMLVVTKPAVTIG